MTFLKGGARRRRREGNRAKRGAGLFRSPLAALAVALSLIVQLFAVPYHQALSAPLVAEADTAVIAASLKATFGDAAALCIQADDKGAPHAPGGCCDDQCPFCRFAAQAAALIAPDPPALQKPIAAGRRAAGIALVLGAVPASPTTRNYARGPPLPV